ncbi:hypothetical protein EJB05_25773, partial [Eragrostis curvula]
MDPSWPETTRRLRRRPHDLSDVRRLHRPPRRGLCVVARPLLIPRRLLRLLGVAVRRLAAVADEAAAGGFVNPELDKPFRPYRNQQQRCMLDQDMAILCHGDGDGGEFTVADLTCRSPREVDLCVLHYRPPTSNGIVPMQWKVHKLPVHSDMKIDPSLWTTDAIYPPLGRMLVLGLLLVDVLHANKDSDTDQQQQLRYIPLPKQALRSRRYYIDGDSPDPFRHVSVTDASIVKLACTFTKHSSSSNNFTIITWSFDIRKGSWTKDCGNTVEDAEFFGMLDAAQSSSRLPRVMPSFPVVSLADPDVVCFMLEEEMEDHSVYWMIEVNMRNKVLQSTARYMREEDEEGSYPGKPRRKFYGHYFVPSKFLSYLSQDGCTRRSAATGSAIRALTPLDS